ncbi:MAG: DUF1295 domain-containing protein [Pseudomonadota bacterium]
MGDALAVWLIGLTGFLVLWPISLWRRDASVVDFWWGPGVGAMVLAAWIGAGLPMGADVLMIVALSVLWSGRLGIHLGVRRLREGSEDARYAEMRAARNPGWWWKSLMMVFVLQAVLQGIITLPLIAAVSVGSDTAFSALILVASAIVLWGIVLQTVADLELDRHRARRGHGGLLMTGTRSIVRHPNYLGEIAVWFGLSLLALNAGVIWAPISVLIVTLLLRYVSGVPIIEERMERTRPEVFPTYRARVPALVPRVIDLPRLLGSNLRPDVR